jgi:hypothetical protein
MKDEQELLKKLKRTAENARRRGEPQRKKRRN